MASARLLYAASDDPYIYLGYVKRALGESPALFSYNPGEHSAGTTGLLYYYLLLVVCGVLRALLAFLPLPEVLLLGLWLLNSALFLLAGAWFLKTASRLGIRAAAGPPAIDVALFGLFCANPKFLWGEFSGLENPLSALLALLVFERLLARAPAWQSALAAAALVATRPETASVLWAVPLLAAITARPAAGGASAALARALAAFGAALVVLFLPVRLATGQWLPSSLGARVQLAPLEDPSDVLGTLVRSFGDGAYWSSEWLLYTYASIVLSVSVVRRHRGDLFGMSLGLLAFYGVRAAVGLDDFDVEDRYVSYLWPLHALVFAAAASGVAPGLSAKARRGAAVPVAVLLSGISLFSIAEFFARFERHVPLDASEPACRLPHLHGASGRDSRLHRFLPGGRDGADDDPPPRTPRRLSPLPAGPSGRLRVDRDDPAALLVRRGLGRELVTWARGREWGDIHLYEVGPPRNAAIHRLAASSTRAAAAKVVAFDNEVVAEPGRGWIAASAPAWIEAGFTAPVPLERIDVVVRPTPGSSPGVLRVEGRHAGTRLVFGAPSERPGPPAGELRTWSFALPAPRALDGIRIEVGGRATLEIVEVTVIRGQIRHWWLDLR